uniref:Uncharacterized protein n=1 Tax=Rhizophora mucronata TaxID=61149 RepID=A0A2P2NMW6_RHIMU
MMLLAIMANFFTESSSAPTGSQKALTFEMIQKLSI